MRIVVTGAAGFLGWHVRVRLKALGIRNVAAISRDNWSSLPSALQRADALIHIAGVNRGSSSEVELGNVKLARDVATAVEAVDSPKAVVFANSIQAGTDNPYGAGKARASDLLKAATEAAGGRYSDVLLPNLFGEHGRPDYNSFVATFIDRTVRNADIAVDDRSITILHAQDASALLTRAAGIMDDVQPQAATTTTVASTLAKIRYFFDVYRLGEIPVLEGTHDVRLFNTLRARVFQESPLIPLTRRADSRGDLIETVRAHGSAGQTFVSSTRPGVTRGQHFHLRKVERFIVLQGTAKISLRRMLGTKVDSFIVHGDSPVAIDMPTLWAHSLTNIGDGPLLTQFWTNEVFNPADTDTYPEEV